MGMPGRGFGSGFHQRNGFLIINGLLQDFFGSRPGSVLLFREIPGMAFAAGKVATGLINGEIIFRA
jgi:hypothetical protein